MYPPSCPSSLLSPPLLCLLSSPLPAEQAGGWNLPSGAVERSGDWGWEQELGWEAGKASDVASGLRQPIICGISLQEAGVSDKGEIQEVSSSPSLVLPTF